MDVLTRIEEVLAKEGLPTPNLPLLREVLDHIDAHPEEFNQLAYAARAFSPLCDTTHCIAGHAVRMSEGLVRMAHGLQPASGLGWRQAGQRALGLSQLEAVQLFYCFNSRDDIQYWAKKIARRAGEEL